MARVRVTVSKLSPRVKVIASRLSLEEFEAFCAVAAKYEMDRSLLIRELALGADQLYGILAKEKPVCPLCGRRTERMHSGKIPVGVCIRCAQVFYD